MSPTPRAKSSAPVEPDFIPSTSPLTGVLTLSRIPGTVLNAVQAPTAAVTTAGCSSINLEIVSSGGATIFAAAPTPVNAEMNKSHEATPSAAEALPNEPAMSSATGTSPLPASITLLKAVTVCVMRDWTSPEAKAPRIALLAAVPNSLNCGMAVPVSQPEKSAMIGFTRPFIASRASVTPVNAPAAWS